LFVNDEIDVLGLGAVAWDEFLFLDDWPPPDAKRRVRLRATQCGGITGNALIAAARFGARCAYAGRLGTDAASNQVRAALEAEGIDTTRAVVSDTHHVNQSVIIVAESPGTRNVFSLAPGGTGADETLPDESFISSARVLLVDHHGVSGSIRAARLARKAEHAVVADLERSDSPQTSELLALANHLILSKGFARTQTKMSHAAEATQKLWNEERAAVVVTCGRDGCWYCATGIPAARHFAAFEVETLDTTGCGDVFHGIYAAALALGFDLQMRLRFASAAAALKATRRSGIDAYPTRVEIEAFLGTR
jgi:sugar/nucleoside kinase (ribokinase family)